MGVKTIFKILLGTVIAIVTVSLAIEFFNVQITGLEINQVTKLSCRQACELFSQETYKTYKNGSGGSIAMSDISDSHGNFFISGDFYTSKDPKTIYTELYTSNAFKEWLNTDAVTNSNTHKCYWNNLSLINMALNSTQNSSGSLGSANYNNSALAKLYKQDMMTPLNLGIPYLDQDTVTKMLEWNMTELLSNCNSSLINTDDNGEQYVYYKGFRVYTKKARVLKLDYKTFDLSNSSDANDFTQLTHIDPAKLGYDYSKDLKSTTDERKYICVVGVQYTVPMSYEGITPLKQLINYCWNTEVAGTNDTASNSSGQQSWNGAQVDYVSGGLYGNTATAGVLPVPGKLIYYVVR